MALIHDTEELDLALEDLPEVAPPDRLLLADPAHFEVAYSINPHMQDGEGALQRVEPQAARAQWDALAERCATLELEVDVLPPLAGHPDLVFCANQVLPVPREVTPHGAGAIVPSHMASDERRDEVPHVVEHLRARGHRIEPLRTTRERVEGMGDGIWHPRRRLLWAGVGPRSSEEAWREIALRYRLPVVLLELTDPDFYHLDTCFAVLTEDTCLWYPPALSPASQRLVKKLFEKRIEAEERECRGLLACNAWCPDGERVLIQRGTEHTTRSLRAAGFEVLPIETGEFLKAGGSVFCMKLAHWSA